MPSRQSLPNDPPAQDLEAARAGDRRAAARVAVAVLPRVRNLVRYLIRGDREVEDVVQEGLVSVLRGLAGYRGEGAFRSWVDRVVARVCFSWLERRGHVEQRPLDATERTPEEAWVTQPDEYLERRRVVVALDQLPYDQRHALVLHHVLELSVPEIAAEIRVSPETVRSRLRIGRARLREALSPPASEKVS